MLTAMLHRPNYVRIYYYVNCYDKRIIVKNVQSEIVPYQHSLIRLLNYFEADAWRFIFHMTHRKLYPL